MVTRENDLEGQYVNHFAIGHNAFEFVFDFGRVGPDVEEAQRHARLVTSPTCAKLLSAMLVDVIGRYEASFGPISTANLPDAEGE